MTISTAPSPDGAVHRISKLERLRPKFRSHYFTHSFSGTPGRP